MWAPAAPGPRQPSPAPSRPGSSRPAPREPGRHNLQSVTPGTRCTFPVASSHVGCQNPVRPGAPASGARPLGSVLIRPLHGADPRRPGRPASSGRRRGKAEPRDTPRSGVAQAEEGENPRCHSRGRRTEAVSAGTRGRGQRRGPGNAPWRTQTTCRGAVCARSVYATPLTRIAPIQLAQKNFAPHSPNPLAQAIGPSGPGLRSPLPQGHPSQLACGLSRCPGPALNWPADPTSSLGHRGSRLENVTALGPLPQPLEPLPQSHGAAGAGLSSLTRSVG